MLRIVVVEAECRAELGQRNLMCSPGKDREGVLRDIVLDVWREEPLQPPHTWIVIGGIEFYVARIGLVGVEGSL